MSIIRKLKHWLNNAPLNKFITIVLLLLIILVAGGIINNTITDNQSESYTEFYILGTSGTADRYVRTITVNTPEPVTVGIRNREHAPIKYRLEISINGKLSGEIDGITLNDGETWENPVTLTPVITGKDQPVDFFLYKYSGTEPCVEPLRLWIDVTE